MDEISAKRYLYNFIKKNSPIAEFEQWVYAGEELEGIFGEKEYFELTFIMNGEDFDQILRKNHQGYVNLISGLRNEAVRLLGFLRKKEIIIEKEFEYIDRRAEADRIELHSLESMWQNQ